LFYVLGAAVLKIPFRSRFQSFQRFWKLGLASRCTLGIILASMTPIPAIADVMRANGDHTRFDTLLLEVVDRDPKGLNCRMPKKFRPALMDSTDAPNLDGTNFASSDVLVAFPPGSQIEVVSGGRGAIMKRDQFNNPWGAVRPSGSKGDCFIRANSRYVRTVLPKDATGWRCRCRVSDCGSRSRPNSFTTGVERKLDPSTPEYGCSPMLPQR
jgi:hypothetical protein